MDEMTSLIDAIGAAPAPPPAAPEPAAPSAPEAPAMGVNPYVPPAEPPRNLADAVAPAAPAPDQGEQTQQPQIPQEYLQAHEWRGKIEQEAQAFGGLDMVPEALKWGRMLFGLDQAPDGVTPAAHFMEALFRADPQVYREILTEVAATHVDRLLPLLEDKFFAQHEIPKARLAEVKDFLRYGRVATTDSAQREFVGLLKPESQAVFAKLKPVQQNFYVDQVDRGLMTLEFAEQEIAEKGLLLDIDERDKQAQAREAEAAKFEAEQRARQVVDEAIGRYQNTFVQAYSKKHGVAPEDVLEKVVFVAGTLDAEASVNERHPAKVAWDSLLKAAESGNEIRIRAAMSQMQIAFEAAFDAYMGRRSGKTPAPANGQQPPGQLQQPPAPRQQQQPQFEPDKPNAGTDWSKMSLDDYLFGRAGG